MRTGSIPQSGRPDFIFLSLLRARSKFVRSLKAVIEDHHEGRESRTNVLDGEARVRRTEWCRTSTATGPHCGAPCMLSAVDGMSKTLSAVFWHERDGHPVQIRGLHTMV